MTLYLTSAERSLYDKLPSALKKAWGGEVVEETGTAWETDRQLQDRARQLASDASPAVVSAAKKMEKKLKTQGFDAVDMADFPEEALSSVLLMLGAVGLTAVVNRALQNVRNEEDLATVEGLTSIRNQILMSNSLVFGK